MTFAELILPMDKPLRTQGSGYDTTIVSSGDRTITLLNDSLSYNNIDVDYVPEDPSYLANMLYKDYIEKINASIEDTAIGGLEEDETAKLVSIMENNCRIMLKDKGATPFVWITLPTIKNEFSIYNVSIYKRQLFLKVESSDYQYRDQFNDLNYYEHNFVAFKESELFILKEILNKGRVPGIKELVCEVDKKTYDPAAAERTEKHYYATIHRHTNNFLYLVQADRSMWEIQGLSFYSKFYD